MDQREGILLVRLKSMGDILFTLPAVYALRAAMPDARICFLISKEYAPLLKGFREVNSTIELDRSRFRGLHPMRMLREAAWLIRQMRRERLRLAIDLQGYGETALLTWASGARERWGTVYRATRAWAYTGAVPRNTKIHPAEDYLQLLQKNAGISAPVRNEFFLPEQAGSEAAKFFSAHALRMDQPTLFIQALTSAGQKNWPLQDYLELAGVWQKRGWQVLFGGGPQDRAALEPVQKAGYLVTAGAPLLVSAGLARLSTLVLGGDTGLLHLAVAMGKRVVMLMRSTLPGSTHPFQHKDWAIGPKGEGLINSITTEAVIEACTRASVELGITVQHFSR
jgi:ADP-heptose:LPS heptosyltransferase